jgi:hypothetical protein
MASPEVWAAARVRVQAVATALGLTVHWPNEASEEPEFDGSGGLPLFVAVDIEADATAPIEIGGSMWRETGRVSVHVLVPSGTGIDAGLAARKAFADGFRGAQAGALLWDEFTFPPGGTDQAEGNWYRLSLGVAYRYTDA